MKYLMSFVCCVFFALPSSAGAGVIKDETAFRALMMDFLGATVTTVNNWVSMESKSELNQSLFAFYAQGAEKNLSAGKFTDLRDLFKKAFVESTTNPNDPFSIAISHCDQYDRWISSDVQCDKIKES